MDEKPAYSVDEILAVHPGGRTSLFSEIKSGRLRARKLGARTIILYQDYLAYLNALPPVPPRGGEVAAEEVA